MSYLPQRKSIPLTIQMVALLVALVILTALAVGIPAIALIHSQLEQQAWSLLERGEITLAAAFNAEQVAIDNLAVLTAQRPSLARLMEAGDPAELQSYLEVLRAGTGLDLIGLCDPGGNLTQQVGLDAPAETCQAEGLLPSPSKDRQPWLLVSQLVTGVNDGSKVVVGRALNNDFMNRLSSQAGLEVILRFQGDYLAGSFTDSEQAWASLPATLRESPPDPSEGARTAEVQIGSEPYYAARSEDSLGQVEIIAFHEVANIEATRRQLNRMLGAGLAGVILIGSGLGYFLARWISRPLERLRDAAIALQQGDLASPVAIRSHMREITQVTISLEDARIALAHSLAALRQEKAWIDQLLESVSEGIMTLDRKGRITYFSPGAGRITGLVPPRVSGKLADEVLPTQSGTPFTRSLPEAGSKPAMIPVLLGDGQPRRAILAVTTGRMAPPEAGKAGIAIVFRDASEEEAMRRLLGDFLANITHEFRTPLAALAASIELLLDQLAELSPEETRELVNNLYLGTLSLQTLIDNLLEGASIEAGRFQVRPQPVAMGEIITGVLRTMQPLLEKYHQRLSTRIPDELPEVMADARRTGQVLINLLSNAIKWSPAGAEITLEVEAGPQTVKVSVGDQGAGLTVEQKQDLFRRFAYLQTEENRAEASAGLGLSVVKAIVTAQQGEVGACDRPGGGVILWFTVLIAGGQA